MRVQLVQNNEKYFMYVNTDMRFDKKQSKSGRLIAFGVIESGNKLENLGRWRFLKL